MSRLKDKAIKWLGGFTKAEVDEIKIKNLLPEPYIGHEKIKTVKLCCETHFPAWEYVPEEKVRRILAEGLTKEFEDYITIKASIDDQTTFYRCGIEIVAREGAE